MLVDIRKLVRSKDGAAWTGVGPDADKRPVHVQLADGVWALGIVSDVEPRWAPDVETPWLDGVATLDVEINGEDIGRVEVPVGCWADGDESDGVWHRDHEGQKVFAALLKEFFEDEDEDDEAALARWGHEMWRPYWEPLGELVQWLLIEAYRSGQKDE